MEGPVIDRGYVAFADGKITAVGPMAELTETGDQTLDVQGDRKSVV